MTRTYFTLFICCLGGVATATNNAHAADCPSGSFLCQSDSLCKSPKFTINGPTWCTNLAKENRPTDCTCGDIGDGYCTCAIDPTKADANASAAFIASKCCTADGYAVNTSDNRKIIQSCKSGYAPDTNLSTCGCAENYYAAQYGPTLICEQCPTINGVQGTTTAGSRPPKTACCIPSGKTFSDDVGSGVYISDCCYTE